MTARELLKELSGLPEDYLDVDIQVYDDFNDKYYQAEHLEYEVSYGDGEIDASKFYSVILITNLLTYQ